jgi:glutamine synthetase
MQALSQQGKRILKLFGLNDGVDVLANIGAEQEYFLIDESMYEARPDLVYAGRTLYGAAPPKGQDLDDHYFGVIKPRVLEFMEELDETLWSLGIASKTRHNEVAPAQHEVAAVYESANAASDHNQLIMETLKTVAPRHGLVALTNEKPFAGVNGSGKHLNWSISTSRGENLLDPGKTPSENARFQLFLCAVIKAVDVHQDLLRMAVATASNDHRLGKAEAPPAIISIFLGEELTEILEGIKNDEKVEARMRTTFDLGADVLPNFPKDTTDRNRTSPFAFTGNKFEFRMVGSSLSTSGPGFILNMIVADTLAEFADRLEGADDFKTELAVLIKETIVKHERIIFNGNNYEDAWVEEAAKRGLLNNLTTVDALPCFIEDENIALCERTGVLTETEVRSRYELLLEAYVKILHIEAATMLEIVHRDIVPAVINYSTDVSNAAIAKVKASDKLGLATRIGATLEKGLFKKLGLLSDSLDADIEALEFALEKADDNAPALERATYYKDHIITAMEKLRQTVDTLETLVDSGYWPLPSYGEILYSVK